MRYNLSDIYNNPDDYSEFLFINGYLIYRIENDVTNKSYIGDTKIHLYNRFFTGWNGGHFGCYDGGYSSHLYNSMRKYGLKHFWISILPKGPSEEDYIIIYDSYFNGYNQNITGKGTGDCNSGMIWINNGNVSKLIHPSILNKFSDKGWKLGRITNWLVGRIWMNKDNLHIRVLEDDIQYYESIGWKLGTNIATSGNTGYCWVNNGVSEWQIPTDELNNSLDIKLGRLTKLTEGLVAINNGDSMKFVSPDNLFNLPEGWSIGSISHSNEGYIYINNGKYNKTIPPNELNKWIELGFTSGRLSSSTRGGTWVVNSSGETHNSKPSDLEKYKQLGFRLGRVWNKSYEIICLTSIIN